MDGRYVLDTNVVIGLIRGEPSIVQAIADIPAVYIPAIVVGELYYGAEHSGRPSANRIRIDEFVENRTILVCDAQIAKVFGHVNNGLRAKGKPIPDNDVWIAATALHHRLTLVSRDGHFDLIEGLSTIRW